LRNFFASFASIYIKEENLSEKVEMCETFFEKSHLYEWKENYERKFAKAEFRRSFT